MEEQTQINPDLSAHSAALGSQTVLNQEIGQPTVVNPDLARQQHIAAGTVLAGKYEIKSALDVTTGEADLYLCTHGGSDYVAKVYRRRGAVKSEVLKALEDIDSPYVAQVYDAGEYQGLPFAILPYYSNGSLQGKTLSLAQLKSTIIPCINEGMKALHDSGIIHKDLKPSNIMQSDDGHSVKIIDFGISSIAADGNTVIVTRTGLTPEYAAPETHNSLFLEESDYYSFGITLYELYTGRTPYKGLDAEQIAQYTAVQRIPLPDDMPKELQDLISGLTYHDITKRNDPNNPNRRWTYYEVKLWLQGKKQVLPGEGVAASSQSAIPPYTFLGNRYEDLRLLALALATNWDEGKKQLSRGLMSSFFRNFHPELAGYCLDAEESVSKRDSNADLAFWELLYKLDPKLPGFHWIGRSFAHLSDLGHAMRQQLTAGVTADAPYWDSILENKLLSSYLAKIGSTDLQLASLSTQLEKTARATGSNGHAKRLNYHLMAYVLSGQRTLSVDGHDFGSVADLTAYMRELGASSYDKLVVFSHKLISYDNSLDEQFQAWLVMLGKVEQLKAWHKSLASGN